jgi:GNAT superfamily N-acetyltransferase
MSIPGYDARKPALPGGHRFAARFSIRFLTPSDLGALIDLREEVLRQLETPDLYVREDDEGGFVRSHVAGHDETAGDTIGVFDGPQLVAYAMLGLPPDDMTNMGQLLDLRDRPPHLVSHLSSCMVRAPYRGQGLQRILLRARFSLARAYGRPICVAMVSLRNHPSRRNLMRTGLRILYVGTIHGLQRQLLAVDLENRWRFHSHEARIVGSDAFDTQAGLTRDGWWGVSEIEGVGDLEADHVNKLIFARPIGISASHGQPR